MTWARNPAIDYDVIVLDEASMISEDIFKDLSSYGIDILAVGDHGQLPPIEGRFSLMQDPILRLDKIHRQAQDNPIINLSMQIRETGKIPKSLPDNGHISIVPKSQSIDFLKQVYKGKHNPEDLLDCAVLSYKNATRTRLNMIIRNIVFGSLSSVPFSDDLVICLRNVKNSNSKQPPMYNGYRGHFVSGVTEYDDHFWSAKINFPYEGIQTKVNNICKHQFGYQKTFSSFDELEKFGMLVTHWNEVGLLFDYGYALTVHKCVHLDTFTETEFGLQRIKDIKDSGKILSPFGEREYNNKILNNNKMIKIKTKEGYSLTATIDHGIDIWNKESGTYERKTFAELSINDITRISLLPPITKTTTYKLPSDKIKTDVRAYIYRIPTSIDEEFAEFLGLMVADGCIFNKGFRLVKRHKDVTNRFSYLCRSLFNVEPKESRTENKLGWYTSEVHSTHLSSWLILIDGLSPNKKNIPKCVIACNNSIRSKFLKGLFEDGTVNLKHGKIDHIEFSNKKLEFVEIIQLMLLGFGIVSSIFRYNENYKLFIYGEYCKIFRDKIGFISSFKNDRLSLDCPAFKRFRVPIPKQFANSIKDKSTRNNSQITGYISKENLMKIDSNNEQLNYHHTKIISIENVEDTKAICITVPNGHQFIQNGFCGWNCQGSQMKNVILFNERPAPVNDDTYRRWAYTATTRSTDKLTIIL